MDQPPDDQFLELWEDAKRQYEKDTKITLAWDVLTTCRTPDALLAKLDNQLGRFEAYRSKQKELQKWLNPMAVAYSKVAFVAFGVMVKAAKNVSESYDGIISLCELQLSFLDRLRVYGMSAHLPIVIQILIHLLSVFALVTKAIKDGRLFTYLKELIGRNDVQKALTKLEDLIKAEKSMGTAETIVFSKDILDRVYGLVSESGKGAIIMAGMNERLEQATQFAEVAHEREMQQLGDIKTSTTDANKLLRNLDQRHVNESIHKWLKFPDPWRNHDDARDLHDDDTGTWLLKSFEYKSWKTTLSSLFWMYGKPGVGKTIICSTVIEDLQATSGAITAFFYFYKRDAEKHSLYGMLSSIIYQLDRQLPDAKSMLLPMHNQFLVWKPRLKNLIGLLEILISRLSARPIFIVLDALDECSEPKELENLLGLLRSTRVHVLVTSRREEVVQMLEPLAASKLDLSSAVKPDISRYLERVFTEDKSFRSWKQADRDHARTYLLDHSDGMFQWVKCQLDELRDCMPQDLEDQLSSLPSGLDATYERTLSRISGRKQLYARHLFNWLAFSFRPLHVKELAEVLAIVFVNDATAMFEPIYIVSNPTETISQICLGLVRVTPDETVQFAHLSIKEFLISPRIPTMESVLQFKIQADVAHTIIAASCLAYLQWLGGIVDIPDDEDEIKAQYPLAQYSLKYTEHAQFNRVSETVGDMLGQLFTDSRQWIFWVSHHLDNEEQRGHVTGPPPLYWAAKLGFPQVVGLLLEHGVDVSTQRGHYGSAFQVAVLRGHAEVVKLLLQHIPDLNTAEGLYGTPLQAASRKGYVEVLEVLLDGGADVNAYGNGYGTAVQVAAFYGRLDAVKYLVSKKARLDALGGGLAQLLFDCRAELNSQAHRGDCTALQAAVLGGWLDIVQYLLSKQPDVNAQSSSTECPTLLQTALYGGHGHIAQLLLDKGASVTSQGGHYPTALQSALYGGHVHIARLLIERGTDVHTQGGEYPSALQSAMYGKYEDIVQLLQEREAHWNGEWMDPKEQHPRKLRQGEGSLPGPHRHLAIGSADGGGSGGADAVGGAGVLGGCGGRSGPGRSFGDKGGDAHYDDHLLMAGGGADSASGPGGNGGVTRCWKSVLEENVAMYGGDGGSGGNGGRGGNGNGVLMI